MDSFDKQTFSEIKSFIESELKFSVSFYNKDYLERRIRSRLRRSQCENLQAYYDFVTEDEDEQEALLNAFSINVTGFFRNQEVWDQINEIMREHSSRQPYRVWSAGCADGREPYSIALLALSDPELNAENIEIIGTDINKEALATAKEGVYTNTVTDDLTEQLGYLGDGLEFIHEDEEDQIRLTDEVRELITFEYHDLIRDDPKQQCDLVLCRNLLIYLERKHETEIFESIADALLPGGHLVIGKAETMPETVKHQFENVNASRRIYRYTG